MFVPECFVGLRMFVPEFFVGLRIFVPEFSLYDSGIFSQKYFFLLISEILFLVSDIFVLGLRILKKCEKNCQLFVHSCQQHVIGGN